MWIGGIYAT